MESIKVSNSYYYRKLKENLSLIVGSLVIAVFCVLISYPGIFYSDSYARVETADKIRASIGMLLSGERDTIEIRSWLTVIPSIFMVACKVIVGNIAGYTLLQAFAFFFLSFLLIKRIATSCRWLQCLLFLVNPLFYCEAVYYEAGVGCVIGIVCLVLILTSEKKEMTHIDKGIEVMLLLLASFVTFGYRANAFTILPVLVIYIIVQNWSTIRKSLVTFTICVGFLLVLVVPKILNIDTMSSSMAGFVWEILTTIDTMEPEKKEEYIDFLDEFGEEGITKRAVEANLDVIVSGFLEYSDLNIYTLSKEGHSKIALEKYIEFMRREPEALLETKWKNALRTLGIEGPLSYYEYEYNCAERMGEYGFNDTIERLEFYRKYYAMTDAIGGYILHPWLVFTISILLVVYESIRKSPYKGIYLFLLFLAGFYYGAYLINTQSFELRYFYPSLYLMWIMDLSIVINLLSNSVKYVKNRFFSRR